MTKINMSGSNVGAKGLCAVIDNTGTVLPCIAIDNSDGTSTLRIVICGEQADGTITPILVDSSGKIVTTT